MRLSGAKPDKPTLTRKIVEKMRKSKTPLYHRIYLLLRQRIEDGIYPPGVKMPGDMALAQEFMVARETIRSALAQLSREARVSRQRGVGTFPLPGPPPTASRGPRRPVIVDKVTLESEILERKWITTPARIRGQLGPAATEKVLRVRRLCFCAARPFCLVTLFIPPEIAREIRFEAIETTPVVFHLEEIGYVPAFAEQHIGARLVEPSVSELLEMPEDSPVLVYRNLVMDAAKRPLVVQESQFDASRYEYLVSLSLDLDNDIPHWVPVS